MNININKRINNEKQIYHLSMTAYKLLEKMWIISKKYATIDKIS